MPPFWNCWHFYVFPQKSAGVLGGLASIWNSFIGRTLRGLTFVVITINTNGDDGKMVWHVFTLSLTVTEGRRSRNKFSG